MAVMTPFGDNTNPYDLSFNPVALDTSTYTGDNASGETPSSNYTPPAGMTTPTNTTTVGTTTINNFAPQVAKQSQGQSLDSTNSQQSPFGITPSQAGQIASKAINGGFTNQINQIDNFGANYLGTGAAANADSVTGLTTIGGVQGSGLGTSSFVDAAGDSVASGTPGAIAQGGNADIANMFAAASSESSASAGLGTASFVDSAGDSVAAGTPGAIATGDSAAEAGSLTSTTLTGILGEAGIGALEGGLLTKLTGGNSIGGSIGGALGGAAGGIAGGAAAIGGAFATTELGAAIGSFIPIPILGTLAGGLIGGAIGGLFGNSSPPTNASGGGGTLTATGGLTDTGTDSKNPNAYSTGYVGAQFTNFSNAATAASTALNLKFSPDVQFHANYSSKHGGANISVTDSVTGQQTGAISFDPSSQTSVQAAYQQALDAAANYSGTTDTTNLDNWYNNTYVNNNTTGNFTPQAAPSIPTNSTFAAYVAQQQGQPNATNGTTTPTPTV